MPIKIFLADDHTIIRDGLKFILQAQTDLKVIGDAANGRDAVAQIRQLKPDVAVLDISMPELNGIDAAAQIRDASPPTRVIILSMHSTAEHIARAFDAGARGYLLKESAGTEVVAAVRAAHAGTRYLSERIAGTLIDDYLKTRVSTNPLDALSPREREILQLVVEGKSSKAIAKILSLSAKTVETYRSRLMQKLNVKNLAELIRFAIRHRLTPE